MKYSKLLFLLMTICLGAASLFGQITGDLQVRVTDPTDAVVANATVTVRSLDTNMTRTVKTDVTGSVRVSQLNIGAYQVEVVQPGFATITTTAHVVSGDVATVPIVLRVASASQQIEVQDTPAALNTVNAQLQGPPTIATITDLPLSSTGFWGWPRLCPASFR